MVNADFRDLFAALNDAGARYLVVGAHAVLSDTESYPLTPQPEGVRSREPVVGTSRTLIWRTIPSPWRARTRSDLVGQS